MVKFKGLLPDFEKKCFYYGELTLDGEFISSVKEIDPEGQGEGQLYILPGLVDAHVHIESSMLSPAEFARQAVSFGTVATISDPHEIANVLGEDGVRFMVEEASKVPLKIHFTAPSCVPATQLETSGAVLGVQELEEMAGKFDFVALGEMMNFPGVINADRGVMDKIELFWRLGKPVDGHAPGLSGEELRKYIAAGISTDHEASDLDEAREKIGEGMKILIREGSAARNFEALWPLIKEYPDDVMLCCDDIHPDELLDHHLDNLIKRGQEKGVDIFNLLRAASINPVKHYGIDAGLLRVGDKADFIIVDDLENFHVRETYINGNCVFSEGKVRFERKAASAPNNFKRGKVNSTDFNLHGESGEYRIIGAIDGDLYTRSENHWLRAEGGLLMADNENDIIRIALVNRYNDTPPALGWIKNTGLKRGAIASSVAHDSHNIIVMGTNTVDMAGAVNLIVENQGGISAFDENGPDILPLPAAGLMSLDSAFNVGRKYEQLNNRAKSMGSVLTAPFMTLSFMALLVIPELKIGERGMFDVKEFKFVEAKSR